MNFEFPGVKFEFLFGKGRSKAEFKAEVKSKTMRAALQKLSLNISQAENGRRHGGNAKYNSAVAPGTSRQIRYPVRMQELRGGQNDADALCEPEVSGR